MQQRVSPYVVSHKRGSSWSLQKSLGLSVEPQGKATRCQHRTWHHFHSQHRDLPWLPDPQTCSEVLTQFPAEFLTVSSPGAQPLPRSVHLALTTAARYSSRNKTADGKDAFAKLWEYVHLRLKLLNKIFLKFIVLSFVFLFPSLWNLLSQVYKVSWAKVRATWFSFFKQMPRFQGFSLFFFHFTAGNKGWASQDMQ